MPGKLYYFDLGGRAVGIRTMLGHAGFEYDDARQSFEQFGALKGSGFLPLGSMPVWEEDGVKYVQSSSILRMLGIRLGYYSEDPMTCWAIDSIVDFCEDLQPKFASWLLPVTQGGAVDPAGAKKWLSDYWGKLIPIVEGRLAGHGKKFIAGTDRPTIADFKAFQCYIPADSSNSACAVTADAQTKMQEMIAASPQFARWIEAMKGELSGYLASRPARPL